MLIPLSKTKHMDGMSIYFLKHRSKRWDSTRNLLGLE
jgi:hypothetical protein